MAELYLDELRDLLRDPGAAGTAPRLSVRWAEALMMMMVCLFL
jgi:hypothetical protein